MSVDMRGWLEIKGAPVSSGTLHVQPLGEQLLVEIGEVGVRLDRAGVQSVIDGLTAWLAAIEPPYQVGQRVVMEGDRSGVRRGTVLIVRRAPGDGIRWDVFVDVGNDSQWLAHVDASGVRAGGDFQIRADDEPTADDLGGALDHDISAFAVDAWRERVAELRDDCRRHQLEVEARGEIMNKLNRRLADLVKANAGLRQRLGEIVVAARDDLP